MFAEGDVSSGASDFISITSLDISCSSVTFTSSSVVIFNKPFFQKEKRVQFLKLLLSWLSSIVSELDC